MTQAIKFAIAAFIVVLFSLSLFFVAIRGLGLATFDDDAPHRRP